MPIWYEPFEGAQTSATTFPLSAVTQRPPFMYHAWGSQNAWQRQIATRNYLYLHPDTGSAYGIADEAWHEVTSHNGPITVQAKFAANVQPDTVWSGNAIGKRKGGWKLAKDAPEATKGFLLNHLISDVTPKGDYANADPVTGQARGISEEKPFEGEIEFTQEVASLRLNWGLLLEHLGERETKAYAQPEVVAARDALVQGILHDMAQIAQGASMPALGDGSACDFCQARGLCRKDFWT